MVQLLIEKGADVNAKREWGETPLFMATFMRHKEIMELLIAKGADVNASTGIGGTLLSQTNQRGYNYKEVAELLRKHGAVE